jgi:hypothetical protein
LSKKNHFLASFIGALGISSTAIAGDSPFGYVYTTDTHPKGKWELEQWVTQRDRQSTGDYTTWQYRTEVEYGVTDALQTSLYLNYNSVNAFHNKPDGTTGPGAFVPDAVDPDARYKRTFFESVSNEWIWRVLSPYKDPLGLALYIEPSYGSQKRELEGKVILQKNFLDDRLVTAANLTAELEREKFHGEWEKESEAELTAGIAYQFAPRWHAGLEYRHHRGYAGYGFGDSKREYSANFFGPSVHYADRGWWITASFQMQLRNARGYTDEAREDIIGGRFFGEDHERQELRVRVGIPF